MNLPLTKDPILYPAGKNPESELRGGWFYLPGSGDIWSPQQSVLRRNKQKIKFKSFFENLKIDDFWVDSQKNTLVLVGSFVSGSDVWTPHF